MSVFGGIMSAITSGSLPLGDWSGGWTNYSSGQSKLKDALRRQYEYAQSYALNNPSWTVEGLRKAGLNPILAATDGSFSSPTLANPTMIGDGSGGNVSFGKLSEDANRRQEELQESQLKLNEKQGELLDAQADKARSDKLKTDVDAFNSAHNLGASGPSAGLFGAFSRLFNGSTDLSDVEKFIYGRSKETGVHDISRMQDSSPSSAKYDDIVIPPSSFRREYRFMSDGIRFHEDDPERFRSPSRSSSRPRSPNWKSRHPYFPWN